MANIILERISLENWEDAVALAVREDQESYVASNLRSIAESKVRPQCNPMLIKADADAVGFFLWARDGDQQTYWIYRFMIDQEFQGNGLGRAALEQIIPFLSAIATCGTDTPVEHRDGPIRTYWLRLRLTGVQRAANSPTSALKYPRSSVFRLCRRDE